MQARLLKSQLGSGPMLGHRLTQAVDWSSEWFEAEPSLAPFVVRAVLVDMTRRGWDDPQGVRTTEYDAFDLNVRPHLEAVLDIVLNGPPDRLLPTIETLLIALRDAYHTPPSVIPSP